MYCSEDWLRQARAVDRVLVNAAPVDKELRIGEEEFRHRHDALYKALRDHGFSIGIVYSDENYPGDVAYLGGNTNITIEPVSAVIGKNGVYLLAGLECGFAVEQLSGRSGTKVRKVAIMQLPDEDYPVEACDFAEVLEECAGERPDRIALLTPRAVFPLSLFQELESCLGGGERIVDAQELYWKIRYEKSDIEMRMTKEASLLCDHMLEGMLAVLRPGMYETQVAQWGYCIARELGVEEMGFDIMVTSGEANRTMVGKALNRRIQRGDAVHIGVAPKRDGLTSCERVSVFAVDSPSEIAEEQLFWLRFVQDAFSVGLESFREVAEKNLPAKYQEAALNDYFRRYEPQVGRLLGCQVDMVRQKPYSGTHSGGYTECQEFYGAITLDSEELLGNQIVTMLDVAVKGMGSYWNDIVIPGLDFFIVEKTLGKSGPKVEVLNKLPVDVQHLVGSAYNR